MKKSHGNFADEHGTGAGKLLALGLKSQTEWSSAELEAALLEQISEPVEFELSSLDARKASALRARAETHGLVLKNLHDLLLHPTPPLELLSMAKDYFKANSIQPQPGLPAEVARALYYLVIAIAWVRHARSISSLNKSQLATGLAWVLEQPWIRGDIRSLAAKATKELNHTPKS